MNKLTLALALGTGVSLGTAVTTSAVADTIKTNQTLPTAEMSANDFNRLFRPIDNAPALNDSYQFLGSPASGTVRSQVFGGIGEAEGKYAYAYQVSVNDVKSEAGDSVYVDSLSYKFNDTPLETSYVGGEPVYAYTVSGGAIGGLLGPETEGQMLQKPASVSWISNEVTGALRAHFVDPDTETPPLDAGSNSAAFVVISDAPLPSTVAQELVNLQSDSPTTGEFTSVYAASGGNIAPVPVPEPTTVLAWAGMMGALALVRRVRKNRPSA
ncbi:MAG: hypothetical protein WKF75_03000 [Singulisphaera sp.]